MSEYTEADLPIHLKHGENLVLSDGTNVRFESNGEAKDIFIGDSWGAETQLFPGQDWQLAAAGGQFKLTAQFEDDVLVEKL